MNDWRAGHGVRLSGNWFSEPARRADKRGRRWAKGRSSDARRRTCSQHWGLNGLRRPAVAGAARSAAGFRLPLIIHTAVEATGEPLGRLDDRLGLWGSDKAAGVSAFLVALVEAAAETT